MEIIGNLISILVFQLLNMILRHKKIILQISIAIIFPLSGIAQHGSIPELFRKIGTEPHIIYCRNGWEVNNQGGHLQGVQLLIKDDVEYAFLSGSSDTYAYYLVAKLGNYNQVLSVNELMYKPYKHAGGIQVFDDLMVVGIEDNDVKDKSKVNIYRIENPDQPPVKPLVIIERNGEPFRSTAGCVAMSKIDGRNLIIVGDWDTKHLDFYKCNNPNTGEETNKFDRVFTIVTEEIDRSGWSDKAWHAYQNINLLKDTDNQLYLFGFGRNGQDENIADMFLVEANDLGEFSLKKLLSRSFHCQEGADFRSGAGIFFQPDGQLKLISCGSHVRDFLVLNIFD